MAVRRVGEAGIAAVVTAADVGIRRYTANTGSGLNLVSVKQLNSKGPMGELFELAKAARLLIVGGARAPEGSFDCTRTWRYTASHSRWRALPTRELWVPLAAGIRPSLLSSASNQDNLSLSGWLHSLLSV